MTDDLMRAVELHDVEENRRLDDRVAVLPARGLAQGGSIPAKPIRRRVELPRVDCAHGPRPAEEMTPERTAEALLAQEAEGAPP